jgi:hypothetical protein
MTRFMRVASYLTNWPIFFLPVYCILNLYLSLDNKWETKRNRMAVMHLLFEMGVALETCIVIIYWTTLHKLALEFFKENQCLTVYLYVAHSFPAVSLVLSWVVTDIRMDPSHWKYLLILGIVYAFINFLSTKIAGKYLYPFLKWEDFSSPLIASVIIAGVVGVYYGVARLSHVIKPWKVSVDEEFKRQ